MTTGKERRVGIGHGSDVDSHTALPSTLMYATTKEAQKLNGEHLGTGRCREQYQNHGLIPQVLPLASISPLALAVSGKS